MTTLVTEQRFEARPATAASASTVEMRLAAPDIVDVWGQASFPASDPPANW